MTREDLSLRVAAKLNTTKGNGRLLVDAVLSEITDSILKGEKAIFKGFGSFQAVRRPARMARAPLTGDPAPVKEGRRIRFKPSKILKNRLNPEG